MSKEEQGSNTKASLKEENINNKVSQQLIESPKKIGKNSVNADKSLTKKIRKETKNSTEFFSELHSTSFKASPIFPKSLKKDLTSKIIINDEKNVFDLTENKEDNKNMENIQSNINNNLHQNTVTDHTINEVENIDENLTKKKKDWKSWSSTEKELFYEAIANGANYCSLQKLFKNMNDKIGTKSSQKIRDYYYRALRNVNKLLKSIGCDCVNRKNRDEVLLSLNCYGKMISSKLKDNSHADGLKNLKKHPRLFKKAALTLKKLITNKINFMRSKKKNVKITKIKNPSKLNNLAKKELKLMNLNSASIQKKIIDLEEYRKLPYKKFLIRIFPNNTDTYYKMIESLYSPRIEMQVAYTRSLSSIIDFLKERWMKVSKKYQNINLYLIPVNGLWVSTPGISFTSEDSKSFDVGDIFIGYGMPSTSVIYMQYSWTYKLDTIQNNNFNLVSIGNEAHEKPNINETDLGNSMFVNKASKSCSNIDYLNNNFDTKLEANMKEESEDEKDIKDNKSIIPLSLDYDAFDPLEYLNIYKQDKEENNDNYEKKNSSDSELDENCLNLDDDFLKNEGENDENSYYGLDYFEKVRALKQKNEEKEIDLNSKLNNNNNSVNVQVLDFSNYSLNNSKFNFNSTLNNNLENNNKDNNSLLKTIKKQSFNPETAKELLTTPTFNSEAIVNQNVSTNPSNSIIKRIPFIRMSPNSKKKNLEEISSSTFSAINPVKNNQTEEVSIKEDEHKTIIRNLNNSLFSNKEIENNFNNKNTAQTNINKPENYLSPTIKKLPEREMTINGTSASHNNKFFDKKIEDIPRFDFDETSNNVNNLIMTNFQQDKNYSMFQDNENSILYKNNNSNLLINDIFNSNFSHINSYMRNNNVSMQNNNFFNTNHNTNQPAVKTPIKEPLEPKINEENKMEEMTFKGKKTKRARKNSPKSPKKKKNDGKEEDIKNNLEDKRKKKCKSPKSPMSTKKPSENKNPQPLNDKNINISNTSPYIFNQNNYYNSYQRPLMSNYHPNHNYPFYQQHSNIGIPDPQNLFIDKKKDKEYYIDNNYHMSRLPPPHLDYMMNYRYPYMLYPQPGPIYPPYQYINKPTYIGKK